MNKKEFKVADWLHQKPVTTYPKSVEYGILTIDNEIEPIVKIIEERSIDIAPDYQSWLNLGFALSDKFGEDGREYYHRLSRFYHNYTYEETDKQFTSCLNANGHGVTIKSFFHLAQQAGIPISATYRPTNFIKKQTTSNDVSDTSDENNFFYLEKMPSFYNEVKDNLPDFLKKIADTAVTDEDADIMILGALTTISSCLPYIYGIYAGREIYPNLFLFVTAHASAGKGKLSLCRKLVEPIHKQLREEHAKEMEIYKQQLTEYAINKKTAGVTPPVEPPMKMLFIPANSSSTALYQALNENKGIGLIFETEGDTLAITFKSDYGNFSDGLRKAFQHEPISYLRRKDKELVELDKPRLSALLSGTPRQVLSLIPDSENGLFSRFIFYYLTLRLEWIDVFSIEKPLDALFDDFGQEFYNLYEFLKNTSMPIRFAFTETQSKNFSSLFEQIQSEYFYIFGADIMPSIRRLGVITFRIAMILSVLRILEHGLSTNVITCSNEDYSTAVAITKTIIRHTAKVFQTLPENNVEPIHGSKNQLKQQFFDTLPHDFDTQTAISLAQSLNIPKPSAERYLKQWCLSAQLNRVKHGWYRKN